jgi:hypothetical protein
MRVHARSLATPFLLQIGPILTPEMRRETSRVSFLMCPFCVRAASSDEATGRTRAPFAVAKHTTANVHATGRHYELVPVRRAAESP